MNGRFSIKCGPPLKRASQSSALQAKKASVKPKKKNHVSIEPTPNNSSQSTNEKKIQAVEKRDKKVEQDLLQTPRDSKPAQNEKEINTKTINDKSQQAQKSKIQKQFPTPQRKKQALSQIQQSKIQPEIPKRNNQPLKNQTPQQKQKQKSKQMKQQTPQQAQDHHSEVSKKVQPKTPSQQSQDPQQNDQTALLLSPFSNIPVISYGLPEDQNLTHDELIQTYEQLAAEYKESLEKREILLKESKEIKNKISDAYSLQASIEKEIMDNAKLRLTAQIFQ